MDFCELISRLEEERIYAKNNFVPIIREKSAEFLYNYVKDNNIKTVLEIGTAIGYSGSVILSAGAEKLTSVDINAEYLKLAKRTFEKFGFDDQIEIYNDDAWNIINQLCEKERKFDMVFLDGAKGQYIKYLNVLKRLLNDNGVIFADNVLLHGMVESDEKIPHKKRTMVVNLRKYLEMVNCEPYETKLIRLEDGIAITKIKGEKIC